MTTPTKAEKTEAEALVEKLTAAMQGVTPGPWDIEPTGDGMADMRVFSRLGGKHRHRIAIAIVAPQKTNADARYIALCSPDNIAKLLTLIQSLSAAPKHSAVEERRSAVDQALLLASASAASSSDNFMVAHIDTLRSLIADERAALSAALSRANEDRDSHQREAIRMMEARDEAVKALEQAGYALEPFARQSWGSEFGSDVRLVIKKSHVGYDLFEHDITSARESLAAIQALTQPAGERGETKL